MTKSKLVFIQQKVKKRKRKLGWMNTLYKENMVTTPLGFLLSLTQLFITSINKRGESRGQLFLPIPQAQVHNGSSPSLLVGIRASAMSQKRFHEWIPLSTGHACHLIHYHLLSSGSSRRSFGFSKIKKWIQLSTSEQFLGFPCHWTRLNVLCTPQKHISPQVTY